MTHHRLSDITHVIVKWRIRYCMREDITHHRMSDITHDKWGGVN